MEKKELIQAYACAKTLWRGFSLPDNELEVKLHDELWFEMLSPYPLEMVLTCMLQYSKESEFCNIGKIVSKLEEIVTAPAKLSETINEQDIFIEIDRAIDNYNHHKNFEMLSPIARRVVGSAQSLYTWAMMDINEFETVTKSHILRAIRELLKQKATIESANKIRQLPTMQKYFLQDNQKQIKSNE